MLKEIKDKVKEIAKQAAIVEKTGEAFEGQPTSMKASIAHLDAIGKLLKLTSELTELNVKMVTESSTSMRQSRIKRNLKDLGYPNG